MMVEMVDVMVGARRSRAETSLGGMPQPIVMSSQTFFRQTAGGLLRHWTGRVLLASLLAGFFLPAMAAEYRSAAKRGTVLYEAPAATAKKRFVVSQGYPVEVVIQQGDWVKIRDHAGTLAWAAARDLSTRRTVVVTAAQAQLHAEPRDDAKVVAKVGKQVLLDWQSPGTDAAPGWVKVRHVKGTTGWVHLADVWGGA